MDDKGHRIGTAADALPKVRPGNPCLVLLANGDELHCWLHSRTRRYVTVVKRNGREARFRADEVLSVAPAVPPRPWRCEGGGCR